MTSHAEINKQPFAVVITTFALLLGASLLRGVLSPYTFEIEGIDHSLFAELLDSFFAGRTAWAVVCSSLLAVMTALVITRIIARHSVAVVKTLIPSVTVIVLAYSLLFAVRFPSVGLLLFCIARSAELMAGSFRREASYDTVAMSGFWLGVAVLLYPPAVVFAVIAPLVLLLYRRSLREIMTALLFFAIPIILCGFGWWFAGAEPFAILENLVAELGYCFGGFDNAALNQPNIVTLAFGGLAAVSIVVAMAVFVFDSSGMRLRVLNVNIQFLLMAAGAKVLVLTGGNPAITLPLLGMCCVPVLNNLFVRRSGAVGIIVYVLLVLGALSSAVTAIVSV